LFESVILNEIIAETEGEKCQYGFKPGVSTAMCTNVLKTTIDYYILAEIAMFFVVLLNTAKLSIVSITGGCLVNF